MKSIYRNKMRRKLTSDEIDYILSGITCPKTVYSEIREKNMANITEDFREQLSSMYINENCIEEIKRYVEKKYEISLAPPGELVGTQTSQSIESLTQATLNSHRIVGTGKEATPSLSKFEELLNVSDKPKNIAFTFYPNRTIGTRQELLNIRLADIRVESLIQRFNLSSQFSEEKWYKIHDILYSKEYRKCTWRLRLFINLDTAFRVDTTLLQISNIVEQEFPSLFTVCSPLENGILDIFVDTSQVSGNEDEGNVKAYIYDVVLPNLASLSISGLNGVKKAYPKEDKEWYYTGFGGKLIDLLSHPDCDSTRTINDYIWDIYDCLGIEAVRSFIIGELLKIMSSDGSYINVRHFGLLCDRMTLDGYPVSVNRHGMNRDHYGPVAKIVFEETLSNAIQAGINSEKDRAEGSGASILTGKAPRFGTGLSDVFIDISKLESIQEKEDEYIVF